jgi:hypothetical protein
MRIIVFLTIAICFLTDGLAQQVTTVKASSNYLAKTGGRIMTPVQGAHIVILNMQEKIQEEKLSSFISDLIRLSSFSVCLERAVGPKVDEQIMTKLSVKKTAILIALIESKSMLQPALLVAPEARWAMINVTALATKEASEEILLNRTEKEIWRAIGYLLGAGNSLAEACLMRPVHTSTDLDNLKCNMFSPEVQNKIRIQAPLLNLQPSRTTTYRKACEEGWAPTPTNSFQKAIWEEVKTKKATEPKTEAVK